MADKGVVVIVGQHPADVEQLRGILEGDRYVVHAFEPEAGAVRTVAAAEPDLLLVDVDLSQDGSRALLVELTRAEPGRDIPVIVVATRDDVEARVKGLEAGDDLVVKPFDPREVLARIERQVTVSTVRRALRESEAKFRSVMESAIDAIISADEHGIIRSWNSAATALFGHEEAEVIGLPLELIVPPRYREAHREGVDRVTSGGEAHVIGKTVELSGIRKDGSEFPVELSLATWFLDERRYYTGIIRDISERKQAEQKFRSVTEAAIDAIISADHTGVIVSWNKAASRILGYAEEEAVGQRLELIIPPGYHDAHRHGMARFTATGEAHVIGRTVELSAIRKNGEEVPIELSLSTWTVREDRYYTGIIRDIGERKRAEDALRRSEQTLRERTEELGRKNAALQETLDQLNTMQNQLIMQEKLASLGKLSAGMAHELNNPASSAQRGAAQLQSTFERWSSVQGRINHLDLDEAQDAWLVELDEKAKERAANPVELSAILRSDREAALEEWLVRRGIEVESDLASALVSMGCEESDLVELGERFDDRELPAVVDWLGFTFEMYSLVGEIMVGAGRIVELVTALKTYTYMDQAPVQEVDVRKGLDNTLIILHNKLKRGINVVREYDGDLPTIQAYASELNQVWTNIIDNATDAMGGQGTLTVRTWREGPWVVVQIEDDGPGIPPEVQSKIFDPFFTTKGQGEGTGLGLNISRNLVVQKHRGEIEVESRPGRTCFTVRLPIDFRPAD